MYEYIETTEKLPLVQKALEEATFVCLDTETTGLDPYTMTPLLLQLGLGEKVFVFDWRKLGDRIIKYVAELVQDSNKTVIMQNASFDLRILYHKTGILLTKVHCTMVTDQVLEAGKQKRYYPSLTVLANKYCGVELSKEVRSSFIDYTGEITEEQIEYSAKDVLFLGEIYTRQVERIYEDKLDRVYSLEMSCVPVFANMEYNGMRIDVEKWMSLSSVAEKDAEESKEVFFSKVIDDLYNKFDPDDAVEIFDRLAIPIKTKRFRKELEIITVPIAIKNAMREYLNLNSPKQLKEVLNALGINVDNTHKNTLTKINNPIINDILKYRGEAKAVSSFGADFLDAVNPVSGKIHTSYGQVGTRSGRVSSWKPNLQNIKHDSDYRECFIADEGYDVITADFSQAELRLLADITKDPHLLKAYLEELDLHRYTASLLYEKPFDEVEAEERRIGKTLNFAIVYGSTKYGLFYNFGIPLDEGEKLLEGYFNNYSGVKALIDIGGEIIYKKGYSLTPLGRRRYFTKKEVYDSDFDYDRERQSIIRMGINHVIQGGSADITKMSLANIFYNNPFGDKLKIIHTVHDEIVCLAKKDISKEAAEFMTKCMNESAEQIMKVVKSATDFTIAPYWSK